MATAAEIQAVLADALANDISWADLAIILKRALINSMISGSDVSLPWKSVNSDGTAITRDDAERLLQLCNRMSGGGIQPQLGEFRNP